MPPAHSSSAGCRHCHTRVLVNEQTEPRPEMIIPATSATVQRRNVFCSLISNKRPVLLAGGGVIVIALLVVVLRVTTCNPGARNKDPQVHPTAAPSIGPSAQSSLTNDCVIYKKKETFSRSSTYCKTRNSRLLNEEDTKTAAHCITRGEDFWAAPVSRNDGECFIYNTDHGFVQMDCLTPRWFICLQT
ncbi:uncharacterized protein ACNLHF_012277 [Anomaloglossus baeobatrachus]